MPSSIEAVLFDIGGTLRSSAPSTEAVKHEKVREIRELTGSSMPVEELAALLASRAAAYRRWARANWVELNEAGVWTQWMLPEYPAALIRENSILLSQTWEQATSIREPFPETKSVLLDLFRRGYRIGIVSNTASTTEAPALLNRLGIRGIPEVVILSANLGIRKPNPEILLEATRRMGIEPSKCAYVGNRRDRDVRAAKDAGFGGTVLMISSQQEESESPDAASPASDFCIHRLDELLGIFPALHAGPAPQVVYAASCSTMWGQHNFPGLTDFFEACRRIGFQSVELNHQVDSGMLADIDLPRQPLGSLHEPCPADVSVDDLKARDWLISSMDEDCRQHGIQAIKRSVDFAARLGLPAIVVHAGMVSTDVRLEQRLRTLLEAGHVASAEYGNLKQELMDTRRALISACFESVKQSLRELLDYAAPSGVRLGLENRFHYYDIPSPDELSEMLAMADERRLGFVYDVGHAEHLSRLGFYPHEDWLRRFSPRILEVHLHDVKGVHDHQAPGLGEVDFDMVARYLPHSAIRTLEIKPSNTPEQVKFALDYLVKHGCVATVSTRS